LFNPVNPAVRLPQKNKNTGFSKQRPNL